MSTTIAPTRPAPTVEIGARAIPYRLTVDQVSHMIEAGIFPPEKRVELLDGHLVDKMTKQDPHDFAVSQLGEELRRLVPAAWVVREEKAVTLGGWSRPVPDLAVVRGPLARYRAVTPGPQDIALIIEVSDTTYPKDRLDKSPLFADAGLACYWIVNIPKRRVEVYTDPAGRGESARYQRETTFGETAEVPVVIDGGEVGRVVVKDVLP